MGTASRPMSAPQQLTHYQPYYCEENAWWLCDSALVRKYERVFVVVVSPRDRGFAMWDQRVGSPIVWDYHVFVVGVQRPDALWVLDADTALGFPCRGDDYFGHSFRIVDAEHQFAPRFVAYDARDYRRLFSSDRSHMRAPDGSHIHPVPAWPPIWRADVGNTLPKLLSGEHSETGPPRGSLGFLSWLMQQAACADSQ